MSIALQGGPSCSIARALPVADIFAEDKALFYSRFARRGSAPHDNMAHAQMSLKGRAFTASTFAPRPSRCCVAMRAVSREQQVPLMDRLAPTMLAGLVSLSAGFTMFDASFAPPARADDEELTPYQKRQAELERRRELLREAREKAAARAAEGFSAPEPAAPAAPAPAAPAAPSLSNSLQSYQAATKNSPTAPKPAEPEAPSAPAFSFSWSKPAAEPEKEKAPEPAAPAKTDSSSDMGSMFSSDMWNTPIKPKAATPEPKPVAPTPFKAPEAPKPKAPEPVKVQKAEVKKAEPTKAGKRRGPLPLWFAEILALGAYAGLFLAVTKYSKQSGEVLNAVWGKVVEAYKAVEKLTGKQQAA